MDRAKRTADIIKAYNASSTPSNKAIFLKKVCEYYDYIKNQSTASADLHFLLFLATKVGVPEYYHLFKKLKPSEQYEEDASVATASALFYHASLFQNGKYLHCYQKEILDKFHLGERNRIILSAPTSFGKTFLVYEIIRKFNYNTILLIFPTISLLSENYQHLLEDKSLSAYSLHTLSEEEYDSNDKNIFLFTPERFLSFRDKHQDFRSDFTFIDEIYKIDEARQEKDNDDNTNDRDLTYRVALNFACSISGDMLLAGPYINTSEMAEENSFLSFSRENRFTFLQYNDFEVVSKKFYVVRDKKEYTVDGIKIPMEKKDKGAKIAAIVTHLTNEKENTIVYCARRSSTESYAKKLLANDDYTGFLSRTPIDSSSEAMLSIFVTHLEKYFGNDWVLVQALKKRIGIHHGLIPKYIQREVINLFNAGAILCLFSTTTITEGVNTSAKNIIITANKKGNKTLKQFDAKNIAGRAGRFSYHYVGRVIDLSEEFEDILESAPSALEHINYNITSSKTDVDLLITDEPYLSPLQRKRKEELFNILESSEIPEIAKKSYPTISIQDKIDLYNQIHKLETDSITKIKTLQQRLASYPNIGRNLGTSPFPIKQEEFQIIIEAILPIVRNKNLRKLIETKVFDERISLITVQTIYFLRHGFLGSVSYYMQNQRMPRDVAVRHVAKLAYSTLKYHLVKYIGLFDLLFQHYLSCNSQGIEENTYSLAPLLQLLEYNALTSDARRISDYGAPFNVVSYYDKNRDEGIKQHFDAYEEYVNSIVSKLISRP